MYATVKNSLYFRLRNFIMTTTYGDRLLTEIEKKQNPTVIGLDPRMKFIPSQIKKQCLSKHSNTHKAVAEAFLMFNKAIIDATHDVVPAYKANMAFYEKYGSEGVRAFEETIRYVKSKGCVAIEDAKRNDIGSTALAYAEGHLGAVDMPDGSKAKSLDVDCIVVNAYLGVDGVKPFLEVIKEHKKGVFILVKTSNPSAGELQDKKLVDGKTVFETLAEMANEWNNATIGKSGYGSVGAVVGATYPEQAAILRKIMPKSIFLVPGYGAQGGGADGVVPCFNEDGRGAIVNSSRGIIAAYKSDRWKDKFNEKTFAQASRAEVIRMRDDIVGALKRAGKWEFNRAERVAEILLDIGAITLRPNEPFRFVSGVLSPIYTDCRLLLSYPKERKEVINYLKQKLIGLNLGKIDVIVSTATSAIPHGTMLAADLNLPTAYVRAAAKGHGKQKRIEGVVKEGHKTIIVEDLISTGGSSISSVDGVREVGGISNDILAIFEYGFPKAENNFKSAKVKLHCLCSLQDVLKVAKRKGIVDDEGIKKVNVWIKNPEVWKG